MQPQPESQAPIQVCKYCGAHNRVTARFCHTCGKTLADENVPAVASAIPVSPPVNLPEPIPPPMPVVPIVVSAPPALPESIAPAQNQVQPGQADAPAPPLVSAPAQPLAVGTQLNARFQVLEILEPANGGTRYRVRDAWRCAACHAENAADDSYCFNCGRELGAERGTCILEATNVASGAEMIDGKFYVVQFDPPKPPDTKPFAKGVNLVFGAKSDAGLVRAGDPDEDSVFALAFSAIYESVAKPSAGLFIVADGIGGAEAGEVASKAGLQTVVGQLLPNIILRAFAGDALDDDAVRAEIISAIQVGNRKVIEVAKELGKEMGTTITLALVLDNKLYVANVGDSRTYLLSGTRLQQISRDHSLVAQLVEAKQIQPEDIYTHPNRNYILRSLGSNEELQIDLFPQDGGAIKLEPGARLLLCCDGLWEMVRDDELERNLFADASPQKICDLLVARANESGGEDNISVVVVSVGGIGIGLS
jgi:serine/threonine protein phosphatase PrpC